MINGQKEIWIKVQDSNRHTAIIAVSNCGKIFFEKYHMSYRDNKSFYNKKWYRYKVYGEQP